jgi:hypothetical protein
MALKLKTRKAHTSWADVVRATLDSALVVETVDEVEVGFRRMAVDAISAFDKSKLSAYANSLGKTVKALKLDSRHTVAILVDDETLDETVVLLDSDLDVEIESDEVEA